MDIILNERFIGEVLKSGDIHGFVGEIANNAQFLYQSEVAKRTGMLAASAHAHTEIGGVESDRWIGVLTVGGAGSAGTVGYAASHEYGAGDHASAEAVLPKPGKRFGKDALKGSTGQGHHVAAAHDLNRVLEELGGL